MHSRAPEKAPAPQLRCAPPDARPLGGACTIVVVPTYEERDALALFVQRFVTTGMELLIVDDSSPDGTGELAEDLAEGRAWMHVLHRAEKDGLGMAYRAGFAWCLERDYALIGQMDCDLSHPPERLAEMRRVLAEHDADLVLGSRYLPGGGTDGWSRTRMAMSRAGCSASRLALGLPFSDLSGGFKLWRADCLAAIDMDALLSTGYAFQVETTQVAHPCWRANRGGSLRLQRARGGHLEDDARDLPGGNSRNPRPAPPPPPRQAPRSARRAVA